MAETSTHSAAVGSGKAVRTSGWYVLLLAWIVFAAAFYLLSKSTVTAAPDIRNFQLIDIAKKWSSYVGAGLGLVTYLVTGIVYLLLRLFRLKPLRLAALVVTALGYSAWLALGYDLVYLEPRYAEVAKVIITYLGKPMLYSSAIVVGCALVGAALTFVLGRKK